MARHANEQSDRKERIEYIEVERKVVSKFDSKLKLFSTYPKTLEDKYGNIVCDLSGEWKPYICLKPQ